MPNHNGCARRPEIVGVRPRDERPIPGVTLDTILPVVTTTHSTGRTSEAHDVEASATAQSSKSVCDCGGATRSKLRQRMCSGWSGIFFALLMSGGLLAAIYFASVYIRSSATFCTSIQECGELFPDRYVCTTPRCNATLYSLAELDEIARTRAYRKVGVNMSLAGDELHFSVNDHHEVECTKNASGDAIYNAAEKAALSCIAAKIDEKDTSVDYIVATETALVYADEWCAIDDSAANYCNTARCTCSSALDLSASNFELATVLGPTRNATVNSTATAVCTNMDGARAIGHFDDEDDTLSLYLFADCRVA